MKTYLLGIVMTSLFFISCKSEKKNNQTVSIQENNTVAVEQKPAKTAQEATHFADLKNAQILWKGFKLTSSHNGSINLKDSYVQYTDGTLNKAYFEIDMTSIKDLDMPADDPYNRKLVDHLKSSDFFDTTQFPVATFTSTSQRIDKEGQIFLTGDLTVKGITKSISFPVSLTEKDTTIYFKAQAFTIDRTDFGIQYKSKKFFDNLKDKFIKDEFEISFEIELDAK